MLVNRHVGVNGNGEVKSVPGHVGGDGNLLLSGQCGKFRTGDVEVVDKDVKDDRPWFCVVDGGDKLLGGVHCPLETVHTRGVDRRECVVSAVPPASLVGRRRRELVLCLLHLGNSTWQHVLLGRFQLAIFGRVQRVLVLR